MLTAVEFMLNGRSVRVEGVSPNTTLLDYLRGVGLTGAKEGCAEGDCGACSVAIVERDAQGQRDDEQAGQPQEDGLAIGPGAAHGTLLNSGYCK